MEQKERPTIPSTKIYLTHRTQVKQRASKRPCNLHGQQPFIDFIAIFSICDAKPGSVYPCDIQRHSDRSTGQNFDATAANLFATARSRLQADDLLVF